MTFWSAYREVAKQFGLGLLLAVPIGGFFLVVVWLFATERYAALAVFLAIGIPAALAVSAWFYPPRRYR